MKKWMATLAVWAVSLGAFATEGWETDYGKALERAKAEKKYVLIDFSGVNWCRWCVRLDKEVFSQPAFKDYAKEHLVLLLVDWPQSGPDVAKIRKKNEPLLKKFGVRGFPTVVILDPEGNAVARMGYQPGGADAYVESLKKVIATSKQQGDKPKK